MTEIADIVSITATTGGVALSVPNVLALEAAGLCVSSAARNPVTLRDTAANIAALTIGQIAGIRSVGVQSIVALDVAAALNLQQGIALAIVSFSELVLPDAAADIQALTFADVGALPAVCVRSIEAKCAFVLLNVAQSLALEKALLRICTPAGRTTTLIDALSAILPLIGVEIRALPGIS